MEGTGYWNLKQDGRICIFRSELEINKKAKQLQNAAYRHILNTGLEMSLAVQDTKVKDIQIL